MSALPVAAVLPGLIGVGVDSGDAEAEALVPVVEATGPSVNPSPAPAPPGSPGLPAPLRERSLGAPLPRAQMSPVSPAAAAEVTAHIRQLIGRHGVRVSIAALDLADNRRYRYPSRSSIRISGVVKLDILETVLLHAQQLDRPLDPADTASATAMITRDDNDGADTLWDGYGGAEAFRAANRTLGTKHTSPDVDRYWALATSDADDQLTLLRNLVDDRPLSAASRAFASGLLRQVDPGHVWGVSAASDPGSSPLVKTGSINADNDDGMWTAGSVGLITVRGHQVLLAVLTEHNPSRQAGIDLVNRLAVTAASAVATPVPAG